MMIWEEIVNGSHLQEIIEKLRKEFDGASEEIEAEEIFFR